MLYIPFIVMIIYIIVDTLRLKYYRKKLKHVIHVNGVRGKSTVVEMLDAVLLEAGYKTFSKTTGTIPAFSINGDKQLIHRKGPANIREQKKYLIKAAKSGADIFIVECMALRKESQIVSETILNADIGVITNIKTDHLEVMGHTHEEIESHLKLMTPKNGLLIEGKMLSESNYKYEHLYQENVNIVCKIAAHLSIDNEDLDYALSHYKASTTISAFKKFRLFNGFTANDLETTIDLYKLIKEHDHVIWFNDRYDRPLRSRLLIKWLLSLDSTRIYLSGDGQVRNSRKLKGKHEIVSDLECVSTDVVFGMGNIKGLEYILEL